MPRPFDQAKGYGFWVSEMEITTGLIWWQPIIDVYFFRRRTTYRKCATTAQKGGRYGHLMLCSAAQEMRVWPLSKPACRSRLQTTLSCCGQKPRWLALRKSHDIGSWQVRVREPSVSKPLMRCRNVMDDVKTGVPTMSQDKSRGNLVTAWVASGIKVA